MIRTMAAAAALLLLPLLAACGSDDKPKAVPAPPAPPSAPSTTVAPAAPPLPEGCDLISADTLRTVLAMSTDGTPSDQKGTAMCQYNDRGTSRTLVVTAYDMDQSLGAPEQLLDQLFTVSGPKEVLPGVGTIAKMSIDGTTAEAMALQQVGRQYRIVQLSASDASGHTVQWRPVLITLEREALESMAAG